MTKRPRPAPEGLRALVCGGLALTALSGCALVAAVPPTGMSRPPAARPPEVLAVDPLSADLAAFYAETEARRLAAGLMRTDPGTEAMPASAARLAEIYALVALRDETAQGSAPAVLRRWQAPVRLSLHFGATTGRAVQSRDRAAFEALAQRLSEASGHPVTLAPAGETRGNFHVLVLSESERRDAGERLRALVPGIDARAVRLITDMPRDTFCMALAFSRDGSSVYTEAVAVIRAEHPDLTRLACYHEEIAQGLGLAADDPRARPSIFNDDQEFAVLTGLDALLLRMHYDARLSPGMTLAQARATIFAIASELVAGAS